MRLSILSLAVFSQLWLYNLAANTQFGCILVCICSFNFRVTGLVWEHYKEDWSANFEFSNDSEALTIFRPWGYQPGHQIEWARFLLTLNKYAPAIWFVPKARYLFDLSAKQAWDDEHGDALCLLCSLYLCPHSITGVLSLCHLVGCWWPLLTVCLQVAFATVSSLLVRSVTTTRSSGCNVRALEQLLCWPASQEKTNTGGTMTDCGNTAGSTLSIMKMVHGGGVWTARTYHTLRRRLSCHFASIRISIRWVLTLVPS